jgi:hypothetical protein
VRRQAFEEEDGRNTKVTQAELIDEAERYKSKVASFRAAHFSAGDHLRITHYILGFLLILVSAVVSGSVLQATDGDPSGTLTLTAGALSIAVVVLTAVQTTFKLGERGEQHRSAAVGFGQLEGKLNVFIHRHHPNLCDAWDDLLKIADEIANVEAGAPGYLTRTYKRARADVMEESGSARSPKRSAPEH